MQASDSEILEKRFIRCFTVAQRQFQYEFTSAPIGGVTGAFELCQYHNELRLRPPATDHQLELAGGMTWRLRAFAMIIVEQSQQTVGAPSPALLQREQVFDFLMEHATADLWAIVQECIEDFFSRTGLRDASQQLKSMRFYMLATYGRTLWADLTAGALSPESSSAASDSMPMVSPNDE